ncbi:MAG: DNA-directed RNA polymerase subunit K [Candidatus Altiarchaeales archaeon WOR_SM1_86-2]|nr:MAG: DNA-directed RNA polymerase subunit K [Candidatus Altiarchaeales archaeon WOR_SM1_86-2]ODS39540.1 MAG: DNA-directed RNA polymerase subunit K [Candidatus Altiarchaeales archaeon WOR_SM1_79]
MDYTKFEIARLIGARALQIKMGAPILLSETDKNFKELKKSSGIIKPIDIAKIEFEKGVLPMTVKRK